MPQNTFTWDPVDYAKSSSTQYTWAKELLSKIKLNGDEKILDVGCGDGKITAEIANAVPNGLVVGIDSSPEMINYAKDNYELETYPNLKFMLMSADEINIHEKFDLVFSNAALHWVKNQEPVIKGIAECLEKNGKIIISCGGKGNASDVMSVLDTMITDNNWNQYFQTDFHPYYFSSDKDYESWLQKYGFRNFQVNLVQKDMLHNSEESFKGWIRTTWLPYTQQLPTELKEKFVEEVISRYVSNNPKDSSGIIHVKMVRLEVDAYKS
jgi:trans-aconitate 2-methyltransferase